MPGPVRPPASLSTRDEALIDACSLPLARAIIHHLSNWGPLGRLELQRRTGASEPGVLKRLRALEDVGIVIGTDPLGERHGRTVQYDVNVDVVLDAVEALGSYVLPPGVRPR